MRGAIGTGVIDRPRANGGAAGVVVVSALASTRDCTGAESVHEASWSPQQHAEIRAALSQACCLALQYGWSPCANTAPPLNTTIAVARLRAADFRRRGVIDSLSSRFRANQESLKTWGFAPMKASSAAATRKIPGRCRKFRSRASETGGNPSERARGSSGFEAFVSAYPRGLDFGAVVGSRTDAGREQFRRYWESSVDVPGPAVDQLARTAHENRVHLVVGVVERNGGTRIVDPFSTVLAGPEYEREAILVAEIPRSWAASSASHAWRASTGSRRRAGPGRGAPRRTDRRLRAAPCRRSVRSACSSMPVRQDVRRGRVRRSRCRSAR